MDDGQQYLTTGPKRLRQSCDILLKLDDGTELPAHSQVLAKYSEFFSDMLAVEEGGPLSMASASSKIKLPLDDCTEEVAIKFLSVLYSIKPSKYIDEATGFSVARLGHKYGMQGVVEICDDVLSNLAGYNHDSSRLPFGDKDDNAVLLALDTASELGMSKLLACCERRMALKPCKDSMIPKLWQRLPTSSTLRIASCLSTAMAAAFDDSGRKYADPFTRLYYEYVPSCQRFWEMTKE